MLPIYEQFYTFQGEGLHAGKAAYFIRTFGCPVHCPWCDSAGTWHPDHIPKRVDKIVEAELASAAAATAAEFVVITGGEPTIHNLSALVEALHTKNLPVHLETSGAFPIRGAFDWVTLSPKRWKPPLENNLKHADEFKIIVDCDGAIEEYADQLPKENPCPVWLHPEWSKREDATTLNAITNWIKTHGAPFRAGWQLHKPYQSDTLDARSAPAVPLGGNPEQESEVGGQ